MSDVKMVLTIDEVLDYLGIDYADDKVNRNITRAIATADKMLQGSIGVNYPIEDARSKELALIIVSDLYDIRGVTTRDNVSNNVRRLVEDMSLQLKLELNSEGNDSPNRASFKPPYIGDNKNWFIWDSETNDYIDTGVCAEGKPGENGADGKDGKDGYTPIKGVDYFDGVDGKDGTNGADGQDGYTPIRGTDYWTEVDKSEIKSYVDEAILGGAW